MTKETMEVGEGREQEAEASRLDQSIPANYSTEGPTIKMLR